jgi:hypothetical protein
MTETAVVDAGTAPEAVEAAPAIVDVPEVVEQAVTPTEDVGLETGDSGGEPQQALSRKDARRGLHDAAQKRAKDAQPNQAEDATEEPEIEATEVAEVPDIEVAGEEAEEAGEEAVVDDTLGRKRDPVTGQFLPEEQAEGEVVAATEVATFDPISIPNDHAVFEMGQPTLTPHNEAEAQVIRALLNGSYARHKDVQNRDTTIEKLDATILDLREQMIRREASEAAAARFPESPSYKKHSEMYSEIKDTVGQEAASAYWRSPDVQNELRPIEDEEFNSRWEVEQAKADEAAGERWAQQARSNAQISLPTELTALPEFGAIFDAACLAFDAEVGIGKHGDPATLTAEALHPIFQESLRHSLLREPKIRDIVEAKMKARDAAKKPPARPAPPAPSIAEVKKEAIEEFK